MIICLRYYLDKSGFMKRASRIFNTFEISWAIAFAVSRF
ncbi:hypothetical protein T11_4152 [Trichinella zimbabwensis]|uniref:Uncharacterized protein n=1 Tax=Trichinella zimbabwensis TaxID=268475 RepID=A0A0V1EQM2_9BILA|nr:hypothetical protein T11_4152 [Trichinella zimbabwensis]